MGINRFIQSLVPKESKFFPLLRGQVEDIIAASELLITFTKTPSHEERKPLYIKIKALESHCDVYTNTIFDELNNTFITPFDREDIHNLASQLDDVLDLMTGSAKRTILYQPEEIPVEIVQMAENIKESALCLGIAVKELETIKKNPEVVKQQCAKLKEIEHKADDVYENFIIALFKKERNAIELLKQMEIIQMLESATDKAEEVADMMKTMIVKYA